MFGFSDPLLVKKLSTEAGRNGNTCRREISFRPVLAAIWNIMMINYLFHVVDEYFIDYCCLGNFG